MACRSTWHRRKAVDRKEFFESTEFFARSRHKLRVHAFDMTEDGLIQHASAVMLEKEPRDLAIKALGRAVTTAGEPKKEDVRMVQATAYFNLGMLFLTKHEGELHVPLSPYEHAHRAFQYAALLQPNNLQFENAERKSREHLGKMQRVNPSEDDDEDD